VKTSSRPVELLGLAAAAIAQPDVVQLSGHHAFVFVFHQDSRGRGGLAFSRLRDFDDRHLYVSRDRSRNDQSDHFIEHPRRCGSALYAVRS
jgi:hypothetical protein